MKSIKVVQFKLNSKKLIVSNVTILWKTVGEDPFGGRNNA